LIPKFILCRCT